MTGARSESRREPQAPRRIVSVVLGLVWAVALWLNAFTLKQLAPTDALWAPAEISIAVLVAGWFIFGAKAAEHAHAWLQLVLTRPARQLATLFLGLCGCALGAWLLWHFAPTRVFARSMVTMALRDKPGVLYEPCLNLEKEPGTELSGSQLAKTFDAPSCAAAALSEILAHSSFDPVLIVGGPASGKRYLLKWLTHELGSRGQPAALMTMRDCRGLESSGGILSVCLDRVLRRIGLTQMDPDRAVRAAQGFDRYREWWLMIDGLDDPGDERLVVPVIRELKMLIRDRGMHVITNARTQNLANILFRARIDEDLRDALRPFRVYSLRGLSPGGSQAMLGAMSRAKEPAAAELNALLGCGPTQATFATLVLRHPGSLTQLADFHASQPARCDSGAAAMREWLLTAKFEAYCRSELCGSDVQKQELRDLIGCFRASVQGSTSSVSRDWIANTLLDKRSCSVKEDRYHNVESVLRALMEIGLVHVIGLDEFEVVREWSG